MVIEERAFGHCCCSVKFAERETREKESKRIETSVVDFKTEQRKWYGS